MKSEIKKRDIPLLANYPKEDYDTARKFASMVYKEFGSFIRSVVIFGGQSGVKNHGKNDIDILIIIDNVSFFLTAPIIETYRIVVSKLANQTSKRLHITTLRFTSFWEYMRAADPIGVNILRTGIALVDTGFFYPMQIMLYEGRIRPSPEAVNAYAARSASVVFNSKMKIMQAIMDLYWGVIDSAHAALMKQHEIPPAPKDIHEHIDRKLVQAGLVNKRCPSIIRDFYLLSRKILHRDIKEMSGKDWDGLKIKAEFFVNEMKKVKYRS
jgi:hypothetical protein